MRRGDTIWRRVSRIGNGVPPHRADTGLRTAVRRQHGMRRHAPLNHGEWHAAKARPEFHLRIETGKGSEPARVATPTALH